ncbi:MAG: hypothetical protein Ct9H90mP26_1110 [Methanobacteriota archaeon]|nr:MAG: hypothetical protein Ct9H90mP26_1110 [Euryarchaeota archaeon]
MLELILESVGISVQKQWSGTMEKGRCPLLEQKVRGMIQTSKTSKKWQFRRCLCPLESEYHGTMSGVMKNSLDWLYSKHTSGKVFALVCTLGGQTSNNTLNHMRIAARWIHGWVIPEQVAVPHIKSAFDEDGELLSSEINDRVLSISSSLIENTTKLRR